MALPSLSNDVFQTVVTPVKMQDDVALRVLESAIQKLAHGDAQLTVIVDKFPALNKTLSAFAKSDARLPFLLAYYGSMQKPNKFFADGVTGGSINLFEGHVPTATFDGIDVEVVKTLSLSSVIEDRKLTAEKLESLPDAKIKRLATDNFPEDLPRGVPERVGIFVARARAVAQLLRRHQSNAKFFTCKHSKCNQIFFTGLQTVSSNDLGGCVMIDNVDRSSKYWSLIKQKTTSGSMQSQFCSALCSNQYCKEMNTFLPNLSGKRLDADPDPGLDVTGQARIFASLRAAARRNEEVARQLRGAAKHKFIAVSKADFKQQAREIVKAVNVDFLLLYAASILAESKTLSAGLNLPGSSYGWRQRPKSCAASLKKIVSLYERTQRDPDAIVYNLLLSSRILEKVKLSALHFFR